MGVNLSGLIVFKEQLNCIKKLLSAAALNYKGIFPG